MPNALRHIKFPSPESADEDGIVAIGGDYGTDALCEAYRNGIFPWPLTFRDPRTGKSRPAPLTWFSPDPRAVLFFDEVHVPRSLERFRRKCAWRFSRNESFEAVMRECAKQPRPEQDGTWITEELLRGYTRLFREGKAWSVEVWEGPTLVGGIYGVFIEGIASGESMFHLRDNASKLALLQAVKELEKEGVRFLDIQVMTPHMERLGAREIPRKEFLALIAETKLSNL